MTYDTVPAAPEAAVTAARELHEYAVNQLGRDTDDVLFTAHRNGTVTGRIAPGVARDDHHPVAPIASLTNPPGHEPQE